MLNEDAYRREREALVEAPCVFERALAARCASCSRARWVAIAEREAAACTDPAARARCAEFHAALHQHALFALRIQAGGPWPFGKEIRAQCGGLRGLAAALGEPDEAVANVAATLSAALARFATAEMFPYSEIMRGVVHFQPRPRAR